MHFQYTNSTHLPPPSPTTTPFTITAPPSTDIWRIPPSHSAFTAPILHTTLPLSHFHRSRVTVKANWHTLYDQGGLFFAPPRSNNDDDEKNDKVWVKAGIEFFDGRARASVVSKQEWADWSLADIEGEGEVTVEMVREGVSLWVYLLEGEKGGQRRTIRKVTWAFAGVGEGEGEGEECWVGVYAAKPTVEEGDESQGLEVRFSGLVVE